MMYFNRLIELREQVGFTQLKMAKQLGIDNSVYAKYEKEYEIMPIKYLNILCDFFNVSFDYLFEFTNTCNYKKENKNIEIKIVGERLKAFRKSQKLTQVKLASILNTVQPVIANYEKGKNLIATPFLYTICKKYSISADYLLGKIDEPVNISNKKL